MAVVTPKRLDDLLARARFQMQAAAVLQLALLAGAVLAGVFSPVGVQVGQVDAGMFVIVAIGLTWSLLVMRSLRQAHLMRHAAMLISQGQPAQAVPFLAQTLEQFSIFRLSKLVAIQYLMEMAYAQHDYSAAARLAGEVLCHRFARRKGMAGRACLLLADSLMEMGDADGAAAALSHLHGRQLGVGEQLQLLPVLLRWQMMSGKYAEALDRLEQKVQLAALLDAESACLVHVLLSAAAAYRGQRDVSRFLLRRARLHYNLTALAQDYPSAASYLVQLQSPDDVLVAAGGRNANGHAAATAVSDELPPRDAASEADDPVCADDGDRGPCTRP